MGGKIIYGRSGFPVCGRAGFPLYKNFFQLLVNGVPADDFFTSQRLSRLFPFEYYKSYTATEHGEIDGETQYNESRQRSYPYVCNYVVESATRTDGGNTEASCDLTFQYREAFSVNEKLVTNNINAVVSYETLEDPVRIQGGFEIYKGAISANNLVDADKISSGTFYIVIPCEISAKFKFSTVEERITEEVFFGGSYTSVTTDEVKDVLRGINCAAVAQIVVKDGQIKTSQWISAASSKFGLNADKNAVTIPRREIASALDSETFRTSFSDRNMNGRFEGYLDVFRIPKTEYDDAYQRYDEDIDLTSSTIHTGMNTDNALAGVEPDLSYTGTIALPLTFSIVET